MGLIFTMVEMTISHLRVRQILSNFYMYMNWTSTMMLTIPPLLRCQCLLMLGTVTMRMRTGKIW